MKHEILAPGIEIYQGDCTEVMRTLEDKSFDAVITDPPYEDDSLYEYLHSFTLKAGVNLVMFCNENYYPSIRPDETQYWIKTPSTKNYSKNCGRFVERILIYRDYENGAFNQLHWSQMIGVHQDRVIERTLIHPYQKPISLMIRMVMIYSNSFVHDPCMGSGTTGVACVQTGRKFTGIELDPGYYEIAKRRIREALMQPRLL